MNPWIRIGLVLSFSLIAIHVTPAKAEQLPLRVLYLGRTNDQQRTTEFVEFLSNQFETCVSVQRFEFNKELVEDVDVVLLDWSQSERLSGRYKSPVGPLEEWDTPTVLLGSAGLLIAGPWAVIGGAG